MKNTKTLQSVLGVVSGELEKGMQLTKCRQCGCMKETLKNLQSIFPEDEKGKFFALQR